MTEKVLLKAKAGYFATRFKQYPGTFYLTGRLIVFHSEGAISPFQSSSFTVNLITSGIEKQLGFKSNALTFAFPVEGLKYEIKWVGLSKSILFTDNEGKQYKIFLHPSDRKRLFNLLEGSSG
jgi:hypothetical protein